MTFVLIIIWNHSGYFSIRWSRDKVCLAWSRLWL